MSHFPLTKAAWKRLVLAFRDWRAAMRGTKETAEEWERRYFGGDQP
jgi:hypothetical protein